MGRRIVAGGKKVPCPQMADRTASALVRPKRRALRLRVYPAYACRPIGPKQKSATYPEPDVPHGNDCSQLECCRFSRLSTVIVSPSPQTRPANSMRFSEGASSGASQGRAKMRGTDQPAYGASPDRVPVWPDGRLRHPHAAKCVLRRLACACSEGASGTLRPRMRGTSQGTDSIRAPCHLWTGTSSRGQIYRINAAFDGS